MCMPPAAAREEKEKLGPLHTVPQTAFPRPRQGTSSPAPPFMWVCQGAQTGYWIEACQCNMVHLHKYFSGRAKSTRLLKWAWHSTGGGLSLCVHFHGLSLER